MNWHNAIGCDSKSERSCYWLWERVQGHNVVVGDNKYNDLIWLTRAGLLIKLHIHHNILRTSTLRLATASR